MTMRIFGLATAVATLAVTSATTVMAQQPKPSLPPPTMQAPQAALPLGKLEVKAYQKIPKAKTAVQLSSE